MVVWRPNIYSIILFEYVEDNAAQTEKLFLENNLEMF